MVLLLAWKKKLQPPYGFSHRWLKDLVDESVFVSPASSLRIQNARLDGAELVGKLGRNWRKGKRSIEFRPF